MKTTKSKARRPLTCTLVQPPICACEMLPAGQPGVLTIGTGLYRIETISELPEEGEPKVFGYRLTKTDGITYDLPVTADSCECMGHLRHHCECKHIQAVRQLQAKGLLVGALAPAAPEWPGRDWADRAA